MELIQQILKWLFRKGECQAVGIHFNADDCEFLTKELLVWLMWYAKLVP